MADGMEIHYGVLDKDDGTGVPWNYDQDKALAERELKRFLHLEVNAVLVTRTVTYSPWQEVGEVPIIYPEKIKCFMCGMKLTTRVVDGRHTYPAHAPSTSICAMSNLAVKDFS